jgi:hypothetical protein
MSLRGRYFRNAYAGEGGVCLLPNPVLIDFTGNV